MAWWVVRFIPPLCGLSCNILQLRRLGGAAGGTLFPGSMALGATRAPNQAFEIAKATAKELAAVGINWNFAPVLNVASNRGDNHVSVRAFGDDPQMVGKFGVAFAEGLRQGGVVHCAKHFHGIASTEDGRRSSVVESTVAGDLELTELGPFGRVMSDGLDSVMLSSSIWSAPDSLVNDEPPSRAQRIIGNTLRRQLSFNGITICDVTDMPHFLRDYNNIGEATLTALEAGCDMFLVYHSTATQQKAIEAIYGAISSGRINKELVLESTSSKIVPLKDHYLSWRAALAAPDPQRLALLMQEHGKIARRAFENSVTVVRDERLLIPLSNKIPLRGEVLLLTPVVRPLDRRSSEQPTVDPFECFGRALAQLHPRIVHAPYRAHGFTNTHTELIKRCSAIILVTVNAARSIGVSQVEVANTALRLSNGKPMINVAACDPYDLLHQPKCKFSEHFNCSELTTSF